MKWKSCPRPGESLRRAKATTPAPEAQQATVAIEWQGQQFTGNNQQVLLEQLEQQGIRVPYSCRAGICGSCRIRLEEGK
jgi:ferredoxin